MSQARIKAEIVVNFWPEHGPNQTRKDPPDIQLCDCLSQIECYTYTFEAILYKTTFYFIQRCPRSSNSLIDSLVTSGCFYEPNFQSITTIRCLLFK